MNIKYVREEKYEGQEERPIHPAPLQADKYSETRRTNGYFSILLVSDHIDTGVIKKWLTEFQEQIDKNLEKSDEYIELENCHTLKVELRKILKTGGAFVHLKDPDKHPDIKCPESDGDCAFIILDYLKLRFRDHQSLHDVKTKNKIPPFVSMRHLETISHELESSVQFIVHKVRLDGTFPNLTSECDLRPRKGVPSNAIQIHLGYIDRHYFYAKKSSVFKRITRDDFESFHLRNDYEISKMKTVNPVSVEDLKLCKGLPDEDQWAGGQEEEEEEEEQEPFDEPFLSVPNSEILKRIKFYQSQDRRADRPVVDLSIEDVRKIFMNSMGMCSRCYQLVEIDNWSLNRMDNDFSHSPDNLELTCIRCNRQLKDNESSCFYLGL